MNKTEVADAALKEALKYRKAGLAVSVGAGKTLIALRYINHFYTDSLRVLVLAPKLSIFDSWKHEIEKFNYQYLTEHIDYSTYLSIDKNSLAYDIVVLDECHNLLESHRSWLSQFKGRILCLSGTWPKYHHSEKGKMVDEFCPLAYEYTTDTAVSDNILNDYRIIVHPLQLSTVKDLWIKGKKGGWYSSERENYNYWSKRISNSSSGKEKQIMQIMRMKALMNFGTKEKYAKVLFDSIDDKVVLFGNQQDQIDRMCSFTYHSNNPDSEENLELFRTGKINKLGCVLQLNEGINIPVRQEIIMHSYGNERKLSQRIGRGLRLNPDETVTIHILQFEGSVDATWVSAALSDFDPGKISVKQQLIIQ